MVPCKVHVMPVKCAKLMELVVRITIIIICKSRTIVFMGRIYNIFYITWFFYSSSYFDISSMQCRWSRWKWYHARYMFRCRSKMQSWWNLWYVLQSILFVKLWIWFLCLRYNFFTFLDFYSSWYVDTFSMLCRWNRGRWYHARYMFRIQSKVQCWWNLW